MSSTLSIPHQVATRPALLEDVAAWTLRRPLSLALGLLCSFQIVAWAPNYLTWPWWADHDVFATAARCWEAGIRPYRDFQGNNFPATIYVFWALGKLCGWGRTPPFYAFDAVLVLVFGLALVAWSTRRLGRALPGLVGYALFLSYYLNLNYTQAAQRDWHGPFFLVGAILLAQARPGRVVGGLAGLLTAAGLAFRPQVVLLLPALFLAFDESARRPGESLGRNARPLAFWAVGAVAGMFLMFLPLLCAGLFDDFLRSLRLVSYGGGYNRVSLASLLDQTLYALRPMRVAAVPTAVLLLAPAAAPDDRRLGRTWLVALAGALLYRPLSPVPHAYLTHPLMVVWAVLGVVLVHLALSDRRLLPSLQLLLVLLLLGTGVTLKPRFCNPNGSREAVGTLRRGEDPGPSPTGYAADVDVPAAARYEWEDYRNLLAYLRHDLGPRTRVANALKYVPAVTGPAGRLPALPAESVAWLIVVHSEDEDRFANALRRTPDSVVVWVPAEQDHPRLWRMPRLTAVIEELYEPDRRFGALEVWRRKPTALAALDAGSNTR